MEPVIKFTPMPSIPEDKPISYYYEREAEKAYQEALKAIKSDSQVFKQVCEDLNIIK